MPLSMYGNTNPKGLEPFQIESTLAPLAVGNNQAEAQMMLENYQQQRQAATNLYGQDLQDQHQAFYDQLKNQMAMEQLKSVPEYAKAGVLPILASQPGQTAFGGADPNAIQGVITNLQQNQDAKNFQAGATGANQLSQAGQPVDTSTVPGVSGITSLGPYRGPAIVQSAQLKLQGDLARAAAASSATNLPRISRQVPNEYNGIDTISLPPRMTQAQRDAYMQDQGIPKTDTQMPAQPLPGTNNATAPASTAPPIQHSKPPQNTAAGVSAAQLAVRANIDTLAQKNPTAAADIKAQMANNNGLPDIVMGPNGIPIGVRGVHGVYDGNGNAIGPRKQ